MLVLNGDHVKRSVDNTAGYADTVIGRSSTTALQTAEQQHTASALIKGHTGLPATISSALVLSTVFSASTVFSEPACGCSRAATVAAMFHCLAHTKMESALSSKHT